MRQSRDVVQTLIFYSRWLAAPFLCGLLLAVLLLMYRFFADLFALAMHVSGQGWHDLIVGVLNLVDIALTANLLLIVVFSGYENFIQRIEPGEEFELAGRSDRCRFQRAQAETAGLDCRDRRR